MKGLLRLNSLFILLAGVTIVRAQLFVPMLPTKQPATATSQSAPPPPQPAAGTPQAPPVTAVPGLLNGYVPDDTYKLRVGDTISFLILEDRIWNPQNAPQSLVVVDSGEMEAPYIGRVAAVGKTCKQLAAEIKTALEKDYYKQATVVLSLNVASPILGRVYIWGQVHNQGPLDIDRQRKPDGGQGHFARRRLCGFCQQAEGQGGPAHRTPMVSSQTFELDMQQILDEGKVDKDIVLQPNDLIIVPSRLINF